MADKLCEVSSREKACRTPLCNAVRIRRIPPLFRGPHPEWLAVRIEAAGFAPVEFAITTESLALALLAGEAGGERACRLEVVAAFCDAAKGVQPGLELEVARAVDSWASIVPFAMELVRVVVASGITPRGCCSFAGMLFWDTSGVGLGRGRTWRPSFQRCV